MVVAVAVQRERLAAAHDVDGQRMDFLAVLAQRTAEDAGGIQLVAAQFGHQAAARAVPEPPAAEFFQRRPGPAVGQRSC